MEPKFFFISDIEISDLFEMSDSNFIELASIKGACRCCGGQLWYYNFFENIHGNSFSYTLIESADIKT